MIYLVQKGMFKSHHEKKLIEVLERYKLQHYFFDHIPFTDDFIIENEKNIDFEKNVIVFGSVRSSIISSKKDWYPGSFYNENHDYTIYSKFYKENLLNYDSVIQKICEPIVFNDDEFFVRPTGDTKFFKGQIYNLETWKEELDTAIINDERIDLNSLIQVCSIKEIYQEVRCFVIKGKVITSSFYKIGTNVVYKRCDDQDILDFAQEMIKLFQLADAFVIDICRTSKVLKVVEFNNFNCAGFYDIDIQKLIQEIEWNFNDR